MANAVLSEPCVLGQVIEGENDEVKLIKDNRYSMKSEHKISVVIDSGVEIKCKQCRKFNNLKCPCCTV